MVKIVRLIDNNVITNNPLLCAFLLIILICRNSQFVKAINCYDCKAEDISCNVGECLGSTCVKMETSNIDNERKTVSKGCSNEYEDNQCKQTYLGPKIVIRCTCDSNFCNGDRNLAAAGLQLMSDSGIHNCAKPIALMITISFIAIFAIILIF